MKNGKYMPLGCYQNIRMGYGTVDYKNLKSIYIKLNSWILPDHEQNYDKIISTTRKSIKNFISDLKSDMFKRESIVDLNIKTRGIKVNKKSFMNLEITLFTNGQLDIKDQRMKSVIKSISEDIVNESLSNKKLFDFHLKKE